MVIYFSSLFDFIDKIEFYNLLFVADFPYCMEQVKLSQLPR